MMPELIRSNRIDVWRIRLDGETIDVEPFAATLCDAERARASRFRFERDRQAFTVFRGALRMLLAIYLRSTPAAIEFAYGSSGKPRVAGASGLHFNVSHSAGLCMAAFATCELGIDVEAIRGMDADGVVARFFCSSERTALDELTDDEREIAFFRTWTRKEAVLKALGDGLTRSLADVCVSVKADETPRVVHIASDAGTAGDWTLHDLSNDPGFSAALAYASPRRDVLEREPCTPAALASRLRDALPNG